MKNYQKKIYNYHFLIGQGETLDTTTIDKTGYQGVGSDNSAPAAFNIDSSKEGMPLYFKDLRNDSYIFFRAYLEGVTEDIAPSWSEHTYVGRSEPVYVYERATRTINFTLKLVAQTEYELQAIYRKMNVLTSMCYPELGFIEALNYSVPDSSTWETVAGKRVPKHITATITWKALHTTPPEMFDNFYGYNGEDGAFMPKVTGNGVQNGITGIKPPDPKLRRTRKWNSPRKTENETTKKETTPTNAE